MPKRKVGRPTLEDPNTNSFTVRFSKLTLEQLEEYSKANNITRGEAVRRWVERGLTRWVNKNS